MSKHIAYMASLGAILLKHLQSIKLRRFLWISKAITVDSVQNLDFIDALNLCLKLRVKRKLISYVNWYPGQLAYQLDV